MSGSLVYVGSLTLGQACPMALSLTASLSASIGPVLASLQAQVTGILAAQVQLTANPPSFNASLTIVTQLIAVIQQAISVSLPGVDFQLAALAKVLVSIQAQVASVSVAANLGISIAALLGAAGIYAYAYAGTADTLGAALAQQTSGGFPGGSGPSQPCHALILATTTPATWAAMGSFFSTGGV